MLKKVVYQYQYMYDSKKFDETSLPEKEDIHCHLNVEDVTDAKYTHVKRVSKDSEIKNFGECHEFYVQSNTLLLALVFKNFRNMCPKKLGPDGFLTVPGLAGLGLAYD